MTWHDIYVILSSTLTPDEKERVWLAAQAHAHDAQCTDLTFPVESTALPNEDPHWDYQDPSILAAWNYMLTCFLVGLQTVSHRAINFDKLREIIQCPTENPTDFLGCLTEALTHHTKLEPFSKDGIIILNSYFISQSFPDTQKNKKTNKKKLQQAEDGPQPPPNEILRK
jgi:hypothetical protein